MPESAIKRATKYFHYLRDFPLAENSECGIKSADVVDLMETAHLNLALLSRNLGRIGPVHRTHLELKPKKHSRESLQSLVLKEKKTIAPAL